MATAYQRLGARVTLVQHGERLIPNTEPEAGRRVQAALEADGVDVRLGVSMRGVRREDGEVVASLDDGSEVRGAELLVAAGRRPTTDDIGHRQHGPGIELGQRRQQVHASLPWLDAPYGEEHETRILDTYPLPQRGPDRRRHRSEPVAVDPVVDDVGVDAVALPQQILPVAAHDQHPVGLEDGLALAVDESGRREVVDVVHRPHDRDAAHARRHPHRRPRRDAVLGVEEVVVAGHRRQPRGQGVDRQEHLLLERLRPRHRRHDHARRLHGPEEASRGVAQPDDRDVRPEVEERLCQLQRVHHAAPGLGRVGDEGDARESHGGSQAREDSEARDDVTRPGRRRAMAAAASEARAAVAVTTQPAFTSAAR